MSWSFVFWSFRKCIHTNFKKSITPVAFHINLFLHVCWLHRLSTSAYSLWLLVKVLLVSFSFFLCIMLKWKSKIQSCLFRCCSLMKLIQAAWLSLIYIFFPVCEGMNDVSERLVKDKLYNWCWIIFCICRITSIDEEQKVEILLFSAHKPL